MTILPFTSPLATLDTAGGKGANLARLSQSGHPVPRGFIISTDAYRSFVLTNHLSDEIQTSLAGLSDGHLAALEAASQSIRTAFARGCLPAETEAALLSAYADFNGSPVAVRSSATAEDLPDLSFAGQQDTYLNIIGASALRAAVIDCWSSLWTARAIGYRQRNGIPHSNTALAVVVQEMVQSEASGVLFTANPLTGTRAETVIDATFGLGEALVSGQVEPDHYVVNTLSGEITQRNLGAKKVSTRSKPTGGVETVDEAGEKFVLGDAEILGLTAMGAKIQQEYAAPQDIEWAFAQGKLYILQSRAITSLFPLPDPSTAALDIWFSFGTVQGMLGPITPLGQDAIRLAFSGGALLIGSNSPYDRVSVLVPAGERLWIKISDVMRNPLGRRLYPTLLSFVEPSVGEILLSLKNDPRLDFQQSKMNPRTVRILLKVAIPILARLVRTLIAPAYAADHFNASVEREYTLPDISAADAYTQLAQRLDWVHERIPQILNHLLPRFAPIVITSLASLNLLTKLTANTESAGHSISTLSLEVTRALPNNVTTEMDLALWQVASTIRSDPASWKVFSATSAADLAAQYQNIVQPPLPETAQTTLSAFLERYGMRGIGEIDLGQPRWRDEPAVVIQNLQNYLQINPDSAPDVVFSRGVEAANTAVEELAGLARRQQGGWVKEKLVRGAARRIRLLMGLRETPKFCIIRNFGLMRTELLASGQDLVNLGIFNSPSDIFFLSFAELEALSRREMQDWKALVSDHRAAYSREEHRKQVPRVLVSDGRTYFEGLGGLALSSGGTDTISGSPVSPGVVEGFVHIVLNPSGAQLAPGEILVCPGTDPAWTPLFMSAGGLITEVGGMMTHGSVVAREYGIPAVVGVHQATTRLKTGQRIRVNGSTGQITVLDE